MGWLATTGERVWASPARTAFCGSKVRPRGVRNYPGAPPTAPSRAARTDGSPVLECLPTEADPRAPAET